MRFFSGSLPTGCPRPDLKKFGDNDGDVDQKFKTNRTQPKGEPTIPLPSYSSLSEDGVGVITSRRASSAAAQPARKDVAVLGFNSNDWVFSQATAVASVPMEEVDSYRIKPAANDLVNDNGNAFSHAIMKKMYRTLVGAHNYIDHNQTPTESRGVLLDARPRRVDLDDAKKGEYVIYIDVLIATSKRRDPKWAEMVRTGEIKFLSMGCESSALQCTRCGHVSFDEDEDCQHMVEELGLNYIDEDGIVRRTAALVVDDENAEGESFAYFVELSYLSVNPAFSGAIQGYVLDVPADTVVEVALPRSVLQREAFQIFKESIIGA